MKKKNEENVQKIILLGICQKTLVFSQRMIIFQHQKKKNRSTEIYTRVKTEFPSLLKARLSKVTPLSSHTAPSTDVCVPEESNTTIHCKNKDFPLLTYN